MARSTIVTPQSWLNAVHSTADELDQVRAGLSVRDNARPVEKRYKHPCTVSVYLALHLNYNENCKLQWNWTARVTCPGQTFKVLHSIWAGVVDLMCSLIDSLPLPLLLSVVSWKIFRPFSGSGIRLLQQIRWVDFRVVINARVHLRISSNFFLTQRWAP